MKIYTIESIGTRKKKRSLLLFMDIQACPLQPFPVSTVSQNYHANLICFMIHDSQSISVIEYVYT